MKISKASDLSYILVAALVISVLLLSVETISHFMLELGTGKMASDMSHKMSLSEHIYFVYLINVISALISSFVVGIISAKFLRKNHIVISILAVIFLSIIFYIIFSDIILEAYLSLILEILSMLLFFPTFVWLINKKSRTAINQ